MLNSTMSLIGNPIKISGVRDLLHKYNNYFFDLDGVIVTYSSLIIVARRAINQRSHLGIELAKEIKQENLLHNKQQYKKLWISETKVLKLWILGIVKKCTFINNKKDLYVIINDSRVFTTSISTHKIRCCRGYQINGQGDRKDWGESVAYWACWLIIRILAISW